MAPKQWVAEKNCFRLTCQATRNEPFCESRGAVVHDMAYGSMGFCFWPLTQLGNALIDFGNFNHCRKAYATDWVQALQNRFRDDGEICLAIFFVLT